MNITKGTRKETIERWEREKEIFKTYVKNNGFPTIKEWDEFAQKNGYLSAATFSQRLDV